MTDVPPPDEPPRLRPPASLGSELAACRSELEQVRREFDGFTYAVAHDLRAPLRAVTGFLEALREDHVQGLPPPAQAYLQRAIDSALRSQGMVDVLLRLSRLGREPLELAAIPLADLVREVRQELIREVSGREIEWRIGPLPTVYADRGLIREAIGQLLANAVKFTRPQPRAVIEIFTAENGQPPVIVVRDNGAGFNAARAAEHLFMPFARFHAQQEFEGMGAGLAIVDRIVRKHGGRLWAESTEGTGATFSFTLGAAAHT